MKRGDRGLSQSYTQLRETPSLSTRFFIRIIRLGTLQNASCWVSASCFGGCFTAPSGRGNVWGELTISFEGKAA